MVRVHTVQQVLVVASSTTIDECVKGAFFTSSSSTDHDTDGCKDTDPEDPDDDNDGVLDGPGDGVSTGPDNCTRGSLGWTSVSTGASITDYDGDGCQDSLIEDLSTTTMTDVFDVIDSCDATELSNLNWISVSTGASITDYDSDGCQDSLEDLDDDNDEICDSNGPSTYGSIEFLCSFIDFGR